MLLEIKHHTRYTYDSPVSIEPHHFYFYPLRRSYFELVDFELRVSPVPELISERIDVENNTFHQYWVNEMLSSLQIQAEIKIETDDFNPFDFLEESRPSQNFAKQPFQAGVELSSELQQWASQFSFERNQLIPHLTNLCAAIHQQFNHQSRYDESLLDPSECFVQKEGSCRDLSWLMICILRKNDLPARFVSGYSFNSDLGEGHELHAWVEVFIEGGGWIGLDPSSGLFTTNSYIPVATSYHPANTLPVQGSYRGSADSHLDTKVEIKLL